MIKNLVIDCEKGIKVNKTLIHKALGRLKTDLDISIESLSIVFLSAESIREINQQFLKHDYSTDIITFNYSGDNKNLDGEIFISVDDAFENSKRFRCSLDNELLRLLAHGLLHMVGYDDKTESERKEMKINENKLLNNIEYLIKDKFLIYDGKNS